MEADKDRPSLQQAQASFRSKRCVFLGYSPLHKGVKCLDVSTGRIYISCDVVFDENVFPFASLHPNVGALLKQQILLLPSSTFSSNEGVPNIDNHVSPIVPITDVQQVVGAPGTNSSENGAPNSSEIEVAGQPENDETCTDSDADSSEHSPVTRDSEARQPEEDSPADPAGQSRAADQIGRAHV